MAGWIYDFRQELDSTIWQMPPMYHRVWQYLKYTVNHSPARIPNKDGTFTDIAPGQHATSYRYLAKGVGYYEGTKWKEPNPKTIKSILMWLQQQNMIIVQGNTYGTLVTIVNWHLYQLEKVQGNKKETEKKQRLDTNNKELINDELMNNKRATFKPPSIEEVSQYCLERKNTINPQTFIDWNQSKGWVVGKEKMKDWKAAVRTWESREKQNKSKTTSKQQTNYSNGFNDYYEED